jgi:hypothetical protein
VTRNAFGNDEVSGGIVATERKPDSHQRNHDDEIGLAQRQQHDEGAEQRHLDDEHFLAAITVGQAAERRRADQNAEQRRGGDDPCLGGAQGEFLRHERERHAGHEHHHALEELAGGGQPPGEPLHVGQRGTAHDGRVRPHRRFVDVVLDGLAGLAARHRRGAIGAHARRMSAARSARHGVAGDFFAHGNKPDLLCSIRLAFPHFTKEMRQTP